jgi:hypothetical protein
MSSSTRGAEVDGGGVLTESALVVVVAEAEPIVGPWRANLDPGAGLGVPAHITLLYPFVAPTDIGDDTVSRVEHVLADFAAFPFALSSVRWFDESVVWLAPAPSRPFVDMTSALLDAFPDHPRYGGDHAGEIVPHLTVGDGAPVDDLRTAAAGVESDLPIEALAAEVTLLCGSNEAGSWRPVRRFPLTRS